MRLLALAFAIAIIVAHPTAANADDPIDTTPGATVCTVCVPHQVPPPQTRR